MLFTLNVPENGEVANNLVNAIIVENSEVLNTKHFASLISASNVAVMGMYSLSPTMMLLVFNSELDVNNALNEDSVLWNMFVDVRRWSEVEFYIPITKYP